MDVTLVLVRDSGKTTAVPMKRARMVIGRKPECEIRIPRPEVSREHCEIRVDGGRLLVRDLGSSNGTLIDGKRISGETAVPAGSVLTIGPATFVIQIDGQPATIDAAAALRRGAAAPAAVAASPAPAARPSAPSKPAVSKSGPAKPAKKSADDSDIDLDFDPDDSSLSGVDFSDLLKDDDDTSQPKL